MANASFLPEDYVHRRAARRTNITLLLLFVLVLGGVCGTYAYLWKDAQAAQARNKVANDRVAEFARRIDQAEQLQAQRAQLLTKAAIAKALVERMPRTRLFSELINNMPPTIIWSEVEIETRAIKGAPPTTAIQKATADIRSSNNKATLAAPIIERQQEVTGIRILAFAPTDIEVAAFMTSLSVNPLFENVTLAFSEEKDIDGRRARNFRIDLTVRNDVDVTGMEPKLVRRDGLPINPMSGGTLRIEGEKVFTPKGPTAEVPTGNE